MTNELDKIDKNDPYFHLKLLRYYYNFIQFYKQDENALTDVLMFEFGAETYSIVYSLLQEKAFEESEILKQKYNLLDGEADGYQI